MDSGKRCRILDVDFQGSLKEGWASVVRPEEYDAHMSNVGQAQANAGMVMRLMESLEIPDGGRILFAGAGTGQMFLYADFRPLNYYSTVFTDISPTLLETLRVRAEEHELFNFEVRVDDIEHSQLEPGFDAAVVVLVLEHVDWKRAVSELVRLTKGRILVVIQENPVGMTENASPHRPLAESLKSAMANEKPHLIDCDELVAEMGRCGMELYHQLAADVPDGKKMVYLLFHHR